MFLPDEDVIENQVFRVDDDWSSREESEKENILNKVFRKREQALMQAREALDQRYGQGSSAGAEVGWLYWFAYENLNAAVNKARIDGNSVSEKLEDLVDEFQEALLYENEQGNVVQHRPHDMLAWSQEAEDSLGRMPAGMRKLMKHNGGKIHQLIGFAYSGTEAVTEGSSEDEGPSMEGG